MRRLFAAVFLLVIVAALPVRADEPDPRPFSLPGSAVVPFHAATNDVDYELYIYTPPGDAPAGGWPVIVVLDAVYQFPIAVSQVQHLADRRQMPQAMVVGIGYADGFPDMDGYRRNRTRDYTPRHVPTGGYGPRYQALSGGGHDFLSFMTDEMLPWLVQNHDVNRDDVTFVGHSYGGLLGAAIFDWAPRSFARYLLISPSLWYDDSYLLKQGSSMDALAAIGQDVRIYMAVGAYENQPEAGRAMVDDLRRYHNMLGDVGNNHLRTELRVFEDETHASIFPAALSTGLRHLFGGMN